MTTPYSSFFDDDDRPAPDFIAKVMTALEQRPDYVGWQTAYNSNGVDHGLVDHSLRHGGWREIKKPAYQLLRDITHINVMQTDVAKRADFRKKSRLGRAEDRPWVDQVRALGALKTEVYIPEPMYFYDWRREISAWQRPHLIDRSPRFRPVVTSPHFTWHPRSAGISVTPGGETVPELLIIIPTRGRPDNAARVIKAWQVTGAFEVARVLFAVDDDDPALPQYLGIVNPSAVPLAEAGKIAVTVRDREPMAKRTNTEAALFAPQFFALGSAGDDHVPETAGWAQRYLEELKRLGSGVVYGDDGFQRAKLCTEWAMTSDIVRALDGRLIPAPVDHLYADNSVMELARTAGMLSYLPEVRITHYHPTARRAEQDEGYQRVNSREQYARDGEEFKRWRRLQLPADVSKLRALHPLVAPAAMPSGRSKGPRHRTTLGVQRGGGINSRPTTVINPRRERPVAMRIPRQIRSVRGLTSEEALLSLADMARSVPADEAIVELGVYQGKSALCLAWGAAQGNGAHVWAIDPWDLSETGEDLTYLGLGKGYSPPNHKGTRRWAEWNVQSLGYKRSITLVQGWSRPEGQAWQGPPVGLLFVDGDHTFEGAQSDLLSWAENLAPGATIVFDDYVSSQAEVVRAVDELVQVGIIERPQLHAGRLAVTRLMEGWAERRDALVDETTAALTLGDVPHPVSVEYVDPEHGLVKGIVSPGEGLLDFTPDPEGDRRPGDGEDDPAWDGVDQTDGWLIDHPHALIRHGTRSTTATPEPGWSSQCTHPLCSGHWRTGLKSVEQARQVYEDHLPEGGHPDQPEPAEELEELPVRPTEQERLVVSLEEAIKVEGTRTGQPIEELNTVQLRALAKARGIRLGVRKDKRDLMLEALRAGE